MGHDVLSLEVSMDDLMLMQLHQPIDQMLDDLNRLLLRNAPLVINLFLKSRPVAVFQDEDFEVVIPKDVEALHEVGAIELVHESRLRLA